MAASDSTGTMSSKEVWSPTRKRGTLLSEEQGMGVEQTKSAAIFHHPWGIVVEWGRAWQTSPGIIICPGNKGEDTFNHGQGKGEGLWGGSVEEAILKLRLKKEWGSSRRTGGLACAKAQSPEIIGDDRQRQGTYDF